MSKELKHVRHTSYSLPNVNHKIDILPNCSLLVIKFCGGASSSSFDGKVIVGGGCGGIEFYNGKYMSGGGHGYAMSQQEQFFQDFIQ